MALTPGRGEAASSRQPVRQGAAVPVKARRAASDSAQTDMHAGDAIATFGSIYLYHFHELTVLHARASVPDPHRSFGCAAPLPLRCAHTDVFSEADLAETGTHTAGRRSLSLADMQATAIHLEGNEFPPLLTVCQLIGERASLNEATRTSTSSGIKCRRFSFFF